MINQFIVTHGFIATPIQLLQEQWEKFNSDHVQNYFDRGYKKFVLRLEYFRTLHRPLRAEEAKELRFMLEALIEAKQTLHGK